MKKLMIKLGKMTKKTVTNTKKIAPTVKSVVKENVRAFKDGYNCVNN